eukprot:gb/GEZN01006119.1/.p1 GENE.gb/GEZN01006119.1/~~gb/GEZN01006119.1/.p1  ORF type:complete len:446 (-),score=98.63 gb/GEZN01006119.1/:323-1660(-)
MPPLPPLGEALKFCEPSWCQGSFSPYFTEDHRAFKAKVRSFVETEITPNLDNWIETGYPPSLHKKFYDAGIGGVGYPVEYGGTLTTTTTTTTTANAIKSDIFYELIIIDELARLGGGGVLNQLSINSMALPPILNFGSQDLKNKVCRAVITGEKFISLAISEPWAGSDVAGIKTTAVKQDGCYIVSGQKKWITGGTMADFFTCAVRTGSPSSGSQGLSLLLLEKEMPGLSVRKMPTQFDNSHSTTFITLDKVRVPFANLIGKENQGFRMLMTNFNHERLLLSTGTTRMARLCYEEAVKYSLTRKTFGKRLIDHQIVRFKLAEMVRQVEALQDNLDRVAYQFACGVADKELGSECALLKVQASKTFEYCAREASQVFGGNSIVKEGRGKKVERLYREVRQQAIPGGSEEILLDLAIRQAVKHKLLPTSLTSSSSSSSSSSASRAKL